MAHYGPQHWWPAESTFEMLIGAILTQNTAWQNAALALKKLKPYLIPEKMDRLPEDKLAECIRSSGFYRLKAQRIRAFLAWYRNYGYDPENVKKQNGAVLRKQLLSVKGIGEETADAMLVYAFDKPFFIADAYSRRFFTRLGDQSAQTYDAVKEQVESCLPPELTIYQEYHALIVVHGKRHCKASPVCEGCPFAGDCPARRR
jgi:endonuclease-3 related protein